MPSRTPERKIPFVRTAGADGALGPDRVRLDPTGRRVGTVAQEVENIPLEERGARALERGAREGTVLVDESQKNHRVSPLTGMGQACPFGARAARSGEVAR